MRDIIDEIYGKRLSLLRTIGANPKNLVLYLGYTDFKELKQTTQYARQYSIVDQRKEFLNMPIVEVAQERYLQVAYHD